MTKQAIIIGGGASGFFAAINLAENNPSIKVTILEKSTKLLSKVRVSGGGRCNVTHHCFDTQELIKNYPRGEKELLQVFAQFSVNDTIEWFKKRGVLLHTEDDGRMFPETNNSETIINCFLEEAQRHRISIQTQVDVKQLNVLTDERIEVITSGQSFIADYVICCTGGYNQLKNYDFIQKCGHTITPLIPSLFTLNLNSHAICELQGVSVPKAIVRIAATKHSYQGPLLITHWGFSGPAVLKLSAYAAKDLFYLNYTTTISINWVGELNEELIKASLINHQLENPKSHPHTYPLFNLPKRLWHYLLDKSDIDTKRPWAELGKKHILKLTQVLCHDNYPMSGKTTFKEEFVMSGGISLKEINFKTMQSKLIPNLYFCGEVLDIDGITGGFNFQNAWSTAWIAAEHIKLLR